MKLVLKILLPVLALAAALGASWWLTQQKPTVENKPIEAKDPLVTVMEAHPETLQVPVFTRGTVTPGNQIQLMSEVGGKVLSVSDSFTNGGFFRKGDELLRIDTLEYDVKIKRAEASVAQAGQALLQAKAERRARRSVRGSGRSQLANFEVQVKQAEANYVAAKAELSATKLQRQRSVLKAPFDGRVRQANISVGQYVGPGVQLGVIYSVDTAEVRLPLSDRQLGLVDVPLDFDSTGKDGPLVTLIGQYGGKNYEWPGKIVRSESGLDERNRLLYVVAEVESPYKKDPEQSDRPPLTSGFFVEAEIAGKTHENLFLVPRQALRNGNQVWTVDANDTLQRRDVDVLYKGKEMIYIKSGLQSGDRVVLSQLDIAVDGMRVRTNSERKEPSEKSHERNLLDVTPQESANMPDVPPESRSEEPRPEEPRPADTEVDDTPATAELNQTPAESEQPPAEPKKDGMSPLADVIAADMEAANGSSTIRTASNPDRLEDSRK